MEAWYIQWYTMLCQSLRYSKVTQLYTYIHSLMFSSIMVYPRRLDIVPCDYLNFDPCINLSQFPLVWNPGVILHYSFLLSLGISPDSSWDKKSVFPRESEKWKSLSHVWLFVTPWTVVHGILQARILEWVAFPFSKNPGLPHCRRILYQLSHKGSLSYKTSRKEMLSSSWVLGWSELMGVSVPVCQWCWAWGRQAWEQEKAEDSGWSYLSPCILPWLKPDISLGHFSSRSC